MISLSPIKVGKRKFSFDCFETSVTVSIPTSTCDLLLGFLNSVDSDYSSTSLSSSSSSASLSTLSSTMASPRVLSDFPSRPTSPIFLFPPLSHHSNYFPPSKPTLLSKSNFYLQQISFEMVQLVVEDALASMREYDWTYFPTEYVWKCKYLHGSSFKEYQISCFWDVVCNDHLLEIKRIKGHGFTNLSTDFYAKFKSLFPSSKVNGGSSSSSSSDDITEELPKKRFKLQALPMPFPVKSSLFPADIPSSSAFIPLASFPIFAPSCTLPKLLSSQHTPVIDCPISTAGLTFVTADQFVEGIQPIHSMVKNRYYEIRLEATKMLCDLAQKECKYLELLPCQDLCTKALQTVIHDDFDEIRQFSIIAFALLMEIPCYRQQFIQLDCLRDIIALVNNGSASVPAYQTVQMRRKAALGLSLIGKSYPEQVGFLLKTSGFPTLEAWNVHCDHLHDMQLKVAAKELCVCYFK